EPTLRLAEQSWLWTTCYGLFAILMLASIVYARRFEAAPSTSTRHQEHQHPAPNTQHQAPPPPPPQTSNRLPWTPLAFVPSPLMLGLTTFLTPDVAPVPLFWVVPLTLYLASFALVFAKRQIVPHALMVRLLPLLALVLVTVIVFAGPLAPAIQAPLHL